MIHKRSEFVARELLVLLVLLVVVHGNRDVIVKR